MYGLYGRKKGIGLGCIDSVNILTRKIMIRLGGADSVNSASRFFVDSSHHTARPPGKFETPTYVGWPVPHSKGFFLKSFFFGLTSQRHSKGAAWGSNHRSVFKGRQGEVARRRCSLAQPRDPDDSPISLDKTFFVFFLNLRVFIKESDKAPTNKIYRPASSEQRPRMRSCHESERLV